MSMFAFDMLVVLCIFFAAEPTIYLAKCRRENENGNNVDIDTENVELASNQIKYNGLMSGINQEFANLKMVMK